MMFMIVGVCTFVIMPLIGMISDRVNKYVVFAGASIVMIISIAIYTHLPQVSLFVLILVNVIMMMGIMARMVPSQALAATIPEMKDRGAFMSINSSLQQMAGGIAALIGGMIVTQESHTSPLGRFDILGYVVIGIIVVNMFLTYRVYRYVSEKEK